MLTCVPPIIQFFNCLSGIFLVLVPCVNVSDKMVTDVITHVHFFHLSILCKFTKDFFVEQVKVILQLLFGQRTVRIVSGILEKVLKENSLTEGGFDMLSGTAVSVTASTDFKVERTIDPV